MPFVWKTPPTKAFPEMYSAYEKKLYLMIYNLLLRRAPEIENWMKENAAWTDRTGNARQSLSVDVIPEMARIILWLSMGRLPDGKILDYGFWLEWANAGRYAIVGPAVDVWGPVILQDMKALLSRGTAGTKPGAMGGPSGPRREAVAKGIAYYRSKGEAIPERYQQWRKELRGKK